MRWDRLISLNVAQPLLALRRSSQPSLPVLMYHSISEDPEPSRSPYYKICTSPKQFASQMRWLAENGYQGVTLEAGLSWLTSTKLSSDRQPVAITFDDGFRDFYISAFPILQMHRFGATMYLPTHFIGDEMQQFQLKDCLTWSEVTELSTEGIEFGSHTVNHRKLVEMGWSEIENELLESKNKIQERIGTPVRSFAYPYAYPCAMKKFVERFQEILRSIGYQSSVTTGIGRNARNSDLLNINRLPINDDDDSTLLCAKLQGAYDWLAIPQKLLKSTRHILRSCINHRSEYSVSQGNSAS